MSLKIKKLIKRQSDMNVFATVYENDRAYRPLFLRYCNAGKATDLGWDRLEPCQNGRGKIPHTTRDWFSED
jgi:hypothetical protein